MSVSPGLLVDLDRPEGATPVARVGWRRVWARFVRQPVAAGALVVVVFLGLAAAGASVLTPYDAAPPITRELLEDARQGPSLAHPFGTDRLGRDQLTRVLVALQKSLLVGFGVALLSTVIGVVVGATAGYRRGWVDQLLMRLTDLVLVLPAVAVLLVLATNPEPSFFGLFDLPPATEVGGMILVISVLAWMPMARIVRGEVRTLRERDFVVAARAVGASDMRVVTRHVLPNVVGPIVVFATMEVGLAILTEATLSFLGAGIQLPAASLGNLIADAEDTVGTKLSYLLYFPGLVLFVLALAVGFVGEGLRRAFDPRADVRRAR